MDRGTRNRSSWCVINFAFLFVAALVSMPAAAQATTVDVSYSPPLVLHREQPPPDFAVSSCPITLSSIMISPVVLCLLARVWSSVP